MELKGTVFFKEEVSNNEIGRPVGVSSTGVIVYQFPGTGESVAEIPFSEITEIRIARESRVWRVIATTGAFLGCAAIGTLASLTLIKWLEGKVRLVGVGAFLFAVGCPFLLIGCLVTPFLYFSRLGYYFHIRCGNKRGKYYFNPKDWDAKNSDIRKFLDSSGHVVSFPEP